MMDACCICGCSAPNRGDVDYAWAARTAGYDGRGHYDFQETEWTFCGPCFDAHIKPAIERVVTIIPPTTNEWGPQ